MKLRFILALLTVTLFLHNGLSQPPAGRQFPGASISGTVVDAMYDLPIPYANIILYSVRDSSQVTGTATAQDGTFKLNLERPGRFYGEVTFIGYNMITVDDISIGRGNFEVDLGKIKLTPKGVVLDEAQVKVDKPAVEFKIDKKVIKVSESLSSTSGSAIDVLENAPSVTVDIDGNVAVRGSTNFTVLVDGRPTLLDANDALQQIPASTIEDIEIITNPSAKFDPDGISGIINVVLKKNKLSGVSGVVNANTGLDDKYGGEVLVSYRKEKINLTLGLDYNRRTHPGTIESRSITYFPDRTLYVNSSGSQDHARNRMGIRGGLDYQLTDRDLLILGLRLGVGAMEHGSQVDFTQWQEPGTGVTEYTSRNPSTREMNHFGINLGFQHDFSRKGHKLTSDFQYGRRDGTEESFSELFDQDGMLVEGKKTTEQGPGPRIEFKVDYTRPLSEKNRFDAGYQFAVNQSRDETELWEYDQSSDQYRQLAQFSHTSDFTRNTHALYTLYAGEIGPFGYQGGLRGEYTYRLIEIDNGLDYLIDRFDLFPSLHLSYQITELNQLMTSYSRRINRPHGWDLEPFDSWSDAYNIRRGNPDLKPEYMDSFDLGMQHTQGRNIISVEGFYRRTNNLMEHISTVYQDDIMLHTVANVGMDHSLGGELMISLSLFKIWNPRLMYDHYYYQIEGTADDRDYTRESTNWNVRLNNDFRLTDQARFQLNGRYRSPSVSSQSEEKGSFMTDLAVKYTFIPDTFSATLQVRDIFGTGKHESTTTGEGFYRYSLREREAPIVMLNMSYTFNNYKKERKGQGEMENFEMEGDF